MNIFNRITLQTPESVELEFNLAGVGNRVSAALIDAVVSSVVLIGFLLIWNFAAFQLLDLIENTLTNVDTDNLILWLIAIQFVVVFLVNVGYFTYFEVFWQGQSPGKRLVKIRVIRDDGRPIGLQQAALRALLRPFDTLLGGLGIVLIALGKQEKRLGDWVAGTLVVQESSATTQAKMLVSKAAKDYAQQLSQVANWETVLPEDFAVIREYLQRRDRLLPEARQELALKLAHQLKAIIGVEELPFEVSANLFLEAVYWAYQQRSPRPE